MPTMYSSGYAPAATLEPVHSQKQERHIEKVTTPDFIRDVAAGRVELPMIPAVVQQLIAALQDPDIDARKIAMSLAQDPVLSAKVLRLANSSFFGGQRSMASIDAAVALIGVAALNRLIVACGVASSFENLKAVDLPSFWRDAIVAATAAHKLAPALKADPEEAYVCGLLHAIGHLILCAAYPEIANLVFAGYEVLRGKALAALETESFGIDHTTASALWVEAIGFPQSVVDTVRNALKPPGPKDRPLDVALRSGSALMVAVASGADAAAAIAMLPPIVARGFSGHDGQPSPLFGKFYAQLHEIKPPV